MFRIFFVLLIYVATLNELPQTLRADVAFSNFGPGDSYNSSTGTLFGNLLDLDPRIENYHLAQGFVSEGSGRLSSVELPLSFFSNLSNSQPGVAAIGIWSHDPGSQSPGQLLWSGDSPLITNSGLDFEIYEINAGANAPMLDIGSIYWIVASSADGMRPFLWAQNFDVNQTGRSAFAFTDELDWMGGGKPEVTQRAFRINVNPVPEPSSFSVAIFSVLLLRRRR